MHYALPLLHTAAVQGVLVDANYFRTVFDYHYWARDRLLAAAGGMTAEEYGADAGFTYPSIRSMLTHTLGAEIAWLNRMRGQSAERLEAPTEEALPSVEALTARWAEAESAQRSFLSALQDEDLTNVMEYTMRDGTPMRASVWELLTIVFSHTIQHRSEAAEALTKIGRSPGNLDFLIFLRERG
jgi:uncharacterized damage-inducible protein DinB